jgi:hypothetical protein
VYVTEHVADAPVPANVHGLVVKVPVPLEVKLTVPAGVLAVPAAVSVTVAVHVPACPTLNVVGQAIVVVVVLRLTVTVVDPLLVA